MPKRIAAKMGWIEKPKPSDYRTVISWNNMMESIKYDADVVFFGASITSDGKWHEYFDSLKICNLGKSGDNLESMLIRVPQISAVHPRKIFLAPEQNDMRFLTIYEFQEKLIILLNNIEKNNPQADIYLESLLPLNQIKFRTVCDNVKIQAANEAIKSIAERKKLTYINLYDDYLENGQLSMDLSYDGQHLYPYAYNKWAIKLMPFIME